MSYILDALRKAERERHLGQPPTLAVPPPLAEPGRRRLGPWLGVGLILGLNAALLAFFLTRPAAPPAVTALPALAAPAPSAPSTPSAPPATPSLPPTSTTARASAPALATPPVGVQHAAPLPDRTAPEPPRPPARPAPRKEPTRSTVTPGSVTIAPAPESVPSLETLSAGAKRGIPALNLDIHIHSADPDKRFVVINGRRYREGDRLGEGPVLETVTRDGAILRQGGQRFRLSVRH
jgi:general secretion pathway protein B